MCCSSGFKGEIWSVDPKYESLAGVACVPSVRDLPSAPDATFIALAAERSIDVVSDLAAKGGAGAIVHASGFGELGAEFKSLETRLDTAAGSMAVIGPNTTVSSTTLMGLLFGQTRTI
jgi:acyl-CoA synthetase (NDP forming)